jgi:hypothetical protein
MSFPQAIERIKKVYSVEHTHTVPDESIAATLGYGTLNGTSKVILSALKKFGLLLPNGDGFRVSQDAIAIIELPRDDPEKSTAIQKLALRPPIFRQLYERYGFDLPSDASIRHFLVNQGFESRGADLLIKFYKQTLEYLAEHLTSNMQIEPVEDTAETTKNEEVKNEAAQPAGEARSPTGGYPERNYLRFQISPECAAEVVFTAEVTQEAIAKLIAFLNLQMDVYPSQATRSANMSAHAGADRVGALAGGVIEVSDHDPATRT